MLFCDLSMVGVILYYNPYNDSDTLSSIIIIIMGLMISPIVNNATSPLNIILSISGSFLICFCLWLYKAKNQYFLFFLSLIMSLLYCRKYNVTVIESNNNNNNNNNNTTYSPICQNSSDSIEMSVYKQNSSFGIENNDTEDISVFNNNNFNNNDSNSCFYNIKKTIYCIINKIKGLLMNGYLSIIGLIIAFSGLTCFAIQNSRNYW